MVRHTFILTDEDFKKSGIDQLILKRKLNEEWRYVCIWKENKNLQPYSLEFRRITTTSVVSISGSFYHGFKRIYYHSRGTPPKTFFTKFMDSGSSSIVIYFNDDMFDSFSKEHKLCFDVTITSINYLRNGECGKCSHLVELSKDLKRLLEPETCCLADVNLKCGNESIPAHKLILSARSSVFAAMFSNPMKKNRRNEVVINDVGVHVLRLVLVYLYSGNLSNLTVSLASDLLFAADKYKLGDLKKICFEFLKDNVSCENVLRILLLGDMYCSDLKSFAIDYISNTFIEFSVLEKTEEWETMKKERPDLTTDILTSWVKAREKNSKN